MQAPSPHFLPPTCMFWRDDVSNVYIWGRDAGFSGEINALSVSLQPSRCLPPTTNPILSLPYVMHIATRVVVFVIILSPSPKFLHRYSLEYLPLLLMDCNKWTQCWPAMGM